MYLKMKTDQYTNPTTRTLLLGTCAAFGGMSLTPALLMYSSLSPAIVPVAFGLTCLLFGGSTLGALMMPKRSLMFLAPVLGGGALLIFGVSIMAMFYPSPILTNVWLYGGLALATAFVAYDTQNAIQGYDGPRSPPELVIAVVVNNNFTCALQVRGWGSRPCTIQPGFFRTTKTRVVSMCVGCACL